LETVSASTTSSLQVSTQRSSELTLLKLPRQKGQDSDNLFLQGGKTNNSVTIDYNL